MFLHLSVILFTGGSASVHAGIPLRDQTPPGPDPLRPDPPGQTPPLGPDPPLPDTPRSRHPREQTPLPDQAHPPGTRHPPPRYASYWNPFLLTIYLLKLYFISPKCHEIDIEYIQLLHIKFSGFLELTLIKNVSCVHILLPWSNLHRA